MRHLIIGAAALAFAAPAAAYPGEAPRPMDPRDRELVRSLPQPDQVEAAGEAIDRVVGAVLDVPVGPLVDAIDAADPEGRAYRRPHRRDETIGDLARRDDPYAEERIHDQVRDVTTSMGAVAAEAAIMAPELRQAIERIARAVDDARYRRERDYRR